MEDEENEFINFKLGAQHFSGQEMHNTFLRRFEENELREFVKKIVDSFRDKNWDDLRRYAHSLKGSSGYIGAETCQKLSETLQFDCQEQPISEEKITKSTNELLNHAEALQKFLTQHYQKQFLDQTGVFEYRPVVKAEDSEQRPEPGNSVEELKSSEVSVNQSSQETLGFTIRRLYPPAFKMPWNDNTQASFDDEDEFDAYEEINKQWRCQLL